MFDFTAAMYIVTNVKITIRFDGVNTLNSNSKVKIDKLF